MCCLALYWLALLVVNHIPLPDVDLPGGSDKLAHLGLYGGLAFLLAWTTLHFSPDWRVVGGVTMVTAAAYGALDEWLQNFVAGRTADFADWTADVSGATIGLVVFAGLLAVWNRWH